MVRFSCFQAHVHLHKSKKTVQLSVEATHKTLGDTSKNQEMKNLTYFAGESKPEYWEETNELSSNADNVIDSSPTERDCRSEYVESTDCAIMGHNAPIKKSVSLGNGLNWKEWTSNVGGSEDESEKQKSFDGSANHSRTTVPDGTNNHQGLSLSGQYQEHVPSHSVKVNYDFSKNESIFSIGDPEVLETERDDIDDIHSSGIGGYGECSPVSPPVIAKSSSLPNMVSAYGLVTSFMPHSRSTDDRNALVSRKKGMMQEFRRQVQGEDSTIKKDKNNGKNPVDDTYYTYNENYVGSGKEWTVPISDRLSVEKNMRGETSFSQWNEIPAKDFRLKRIEEWISNLQHCSPVEDFNEFASFDNHELPKGTDLPEEPTVSKLEVNVTPGMEAGKRYISHLNASASSAQLTNLGLVVIPFLSAFVSLKVLNLSGNAIVRITAGALPRGLHVLNLSKNSISMIEGLRDLTRLRVLDLSYNRITRIAHGLAGCSSIKELYLAGNKISEVEGLHRLLKLNVLDLRLNKISTAKCLGQLASNHNCLQALSLEGNPAQKNMGDEQLKKYVQSLLPYLTYYNRQSVKVGTAKDTSDRVSQSGIGGLRVEAKSTRKGAHGIVAQKLTSLSSHARKSQVVPSQKSSRSKLGRVPLSGIKTNAQVGQITNFNSRLISLRNVVSIHRSQSEGTLGTLH